MFYSPNNPESAQLAEAIRQSVVTSLQPENTRQNKEAGEEIYLLTHCQVPAVLVECGFLSRPRGSGVTGARRISTANGGVYLTMGSSPS